MRGPILQAKGLYCGYEDYIVLHGIEFNIYPGELVGILGPNGSGKTTLIRAITKVLTPLKGCIFYNGRPISDMSYLEMARCIAVVPQGVESSVLTTTVEEHILLGRLPHFKRFQWFESSEDIKIAFEVMEQVGVIGLRHKILGNISGGEAQRVFIARALVQKPYLLLMDEPVVHLDLNHRVEIFELLKKIMRKGGVTVACVLHDINLASKYCDRLIVLKDGKIVCEGYPSDVITKENIEEIYKVRLEICRTKKDYPQVLY